MVKLIKNQNKFIMTVPMSKIKSKGWKGGEEFDVNFNENGDLVYIELKGE
jgi:hypothetical protein